MEADKAKEKVEQKLYRAVQKLGNTEREAVVLYYFADLSQEEIAKILGLTYG